MNTKIVILDGHTTNPGDLSWDALNALGDCTIHDRTPPEQIVARCADAEVVITNKVLLTAEVIEQLPDLKYIGLLSTGCNAVDLDAAAARGIPVTNVPTYSTDSVAQLVFAHLLNLCHHAAEHSQEAKSGKWAGSIDFCYWDHPLIELKGLTMGIVGLGRIGTATAKLALAFGMRVIASSGTSANSIEGVNVVDLDTLFQTSDVVSLHCPLTEATERLVDCDRLATMKPSAFLINTGRGPLVDEQALADALNNGVIAGAGVDVLVEEPPAADCPLLGAANCVVTPHIAWATREARERLMQIVVQNVSAYQAGSPVNVVNNL